MSYECGVFPRLACTQYKHSTPEACAEHEERCLADAILVAAHGMTREERETLFRLLREDFCVHCGTARLPCHCENDE